MNKVYSNDELYRLSPVLKPEFRDGVIYIDDFYENAEDIYDMITSRASSRSTVPASKARIASRARLSRFMKSS